MHYRMVMDARVCLVHREQTRVIIGVKMNVRAHAIERYREHHPAADRPEVLAAIQQGTPRSPELVAALCGRGQPSRNDRYWSAPDDWGIFVVADRVVVTYLRLSPSQRAVLTMDVSTTTARPRVDENPRIQSTPINGRTKYEVTVLGVPYFQVTLAPSAEAILGMSYKDFWTKLPAISVLSNALEFAIVSVNKARLIALPSRKFSGFILYPESESTLRLKAHRDRVKDRLSKGLPVQVSAHPAATAG